MSTQLPRDLPEIPDSDELLAAEYVLGLLDAGQRRQLQTRIAGDAAFAAQVAAWETRFAPWLDDVAPAGVPANAWPRIRAALWQHELPQRAVPVVDTRPSLWSRLSFWRGLAGGGFAVAAASLAALFVTMQQLPPAPTATPVVVATSKPAMPMVVSLRRDDGSMAYSATVDAQTGVITLMPVSMPKGKGVPELWMIDSGGTPHSLGLLAVDHGMHIVMPRQFMPETVPNAVFAVSMEPEGGSPTGLPTGPVVAKGNLIRL